MTHVRRPPLIPRLTKIVATLGPASGRSSTIRDMIRAGMDVVRLNASHGTLAEHAALVRAVRAEAAGERRHVGVLLDLAGAKLRTGVAPADSLAVPTGSAVTLARGSEPSVPGTIWVNYPGAMTDIREGHRVLLADGDIELRVQSAGPLALECAVVAGGRLGSHKGVAFPDSSLSLPALTDQDLAAVDAGAAAGVDFFGLSFAASGAHVRDLRDRIAAVGSDARVIAKIERRQAVENLDEILLEADGAMVARGDLGVELPLERVPLEQRRIIRAGGRRLKPVITATQMLDSMVVNPRPTRAEASDVANAVWDLSDAVMLSDETAVGRDPVAAVATMDRIVRAAESAPAQESLPVPSLETDNHSFVIAAAARRMAEYDANVRAIVCFTGQGTTAWLLSKVHPPVPVYAVSPEVGTCRRLSLARGVVPVLGARVRSSEELLRMVDQVLLEEGHLEPGDEAVVVASLPLSRSGATNLLKLHRLGDSLAFVP